MDTKKVLVAAAEKYFDVIRPSIPEGFEIIFTSTLSGAVFHLRNGVDVLVCDVAFDELQLFDLLEHADAVLTSTRAVCVHCGDTELDPMADALIDMAARRAGAIGFLNMRENKFLVHKQQTLRSLMLGNDAVPSVG